VSKRPPKNGEIREKIQNTLLVDGNALFKAGYFGAKNEYNHRGEHIGGIYQFITILRMLLTENMYHKVYVFWDGNFSGKLRYQIYEPYKSDRGKDYIYGTQPIDEEEIRQRRVVMKYLEDLFIRQLKHEYVESDDLIAYYCLNRKANEKITICTNDTDMAQLISENIRIYFLHLKKYVDSDNFYSYFCYHLENAALIKSMVGDNSDSIKGIKGLGVDSLLKHFPELKEKKVSLTKILERAKEIQEERKLQKKKPLVVLDNIINKVTDSVLGDKIYEVNYKLVNLKEPFMSKDSIRELELLTEGELDPEGRSLKNVLSYLEKDGIKKLIGEVRYENYLLPFKELIIRETKNTKL
jgi:5'-3' exonuclease